jgi:hypothetical protein
LIDWKRKLIRNRINNEGHYPLIQTDHKAQLSPLPNQKILDFLFMKRAEKGFLGSFLDEFVENVKNKLFGIRL